MFKYSVLGLFVTTLVILLVVSFQIPANAAKKSMKKSDTVVENPNRIEKGNLVIENIPEIPGELKLRTQQFSNIRRASFLDWYPNGGSGFLMTTRFGDTSQIFKVREPKGTRQQITFFDEPVRNAYACPKKDCFIFLKDIGGNEFKQIFLYDLNEGSYKILTDGKSRYGVISWNNKGDKFAYYSTERNGKDWDVYVKNLDNPLESKLVYKGEGTWFPGAWSPDDKKITLGRYVSANESYLYVLDIESGKLEPVNQKDKKIAYGGADWAPDGKGLFLTSDEFGEFKTLQFYDLLTKKIETVSQNKKWDVEEFQISKNGEKLAYTINKGGASELHVLELPSRQTVSVPALPLGVIRNFKFKGDGSQLAVNVTTPVVPGDVFVIDFGFWSNKLTRWTESEVGGLNTARFVEPEIINYKSFDEVELQSLYLKPKESKFKKLPVVIRIHGGPEAQYRPWFSGWNQFFTTELGAAVLAPNVRGSSGYGKSFLQLDNGYKREDSVKDIGALLDWVKANPDLDEKRVVVMGGSYGGYMTLAALVHYSDRLRGGIDSVGISNFVTFLKNTKDYRRDLRRVEYGDERVEEMQKFLHKISPNNNAEKIKAPLFVIQGLNDPRVPATEAEQIVETVKEKGGDVWYLLAKDEGHGFSKKPNVDFQFQSTILFLEKFLLN